MCVAFARGGVHEIRYAYTGACMQAGMRDIKETTLVLFIHPFDLVILRISPLSLSGTLLL